MEKLRLPSAHAIRVLWTLLGEMYRFGHNGVSGHHAMKERLRMNPQTIRHTVAFRLIHPVGSAEERRFLEAGQSILSPIPGVQRFEVLKQVSSKNSYTFGFSMEFADQNAYDGYNRHPSHVKFVEERWKSEVAEFLEIDYEEWTGQ